MPTARIRPVVRTWLVGLFDDTDDMSIDPPALPVPSEWGRFGISDVIELQAGKQSSVFAAKVDGLDVAVKLADRRLADPAVLEDRMAAVESIAVDLPEVVRPRRLDGELVQPIGGWLMTATPFVSGEALDLSRPETSELMGRTLARIHNAMAGVGLRDLPAVAALSTTPADVDRSTWQLLHGDFNDQNMIGTPVGLRVFDFDDCGYGPTEFDIANSLYMVLFDADVHDRAGLYDAFRPTFLTGYAEESGRQLDNEIIDELITVRIGVLARWLDDLPSAPIGIRTSSLEWQDTLRSFVRSQSRPIIR